MNTRADKWIEKLNTITAEEREDQRAVCVLLGHVSSGECFMTAHPIHVCYFCIDEFYMCPDCPQCRRETAMKERFTR